MLLHDITHVCMKAELLEGKAPYSGMQPARAYLQIATEGRLTLKTAINSADQKQLKDFIDKWCGIRAFSYSATLAYL